MDVFLVALQLVFFLPLVVRLARQDLGAMAPSGLGAELKLGAQVPVMIVHALGVLLLWGAVAFAVAGGRIPRGLTASGIGGAVLIVAGVVLFAWAYATLRSWRLLPTIEPGHALCTTGPYGLVRHPMYLALTLLGAGTAVWVASWPAAIAAALIVVGGDGRARLEEQALLATFGAEYRAYGARVRRLIPGVY